ncbi:hypothetical protein BYT27DRAFT_7259540 [Phlegmacium glaucopus]|nr:hypothetical protein BYT27DRAFT_7259540 [Phlegmacium glaucopus]
MASTASTPTAAAAPTVAAADTPATVTAALPRSLTEHFSDAFKEFVNTVEDFGSTPARVQQKFVKMMVHDVYKMKDLVRQMIESHEFTDHDPEELRKLGNTILASTTFRTDCGELSIAMADVKKLLEELDRLRPPVTASSPIEDFGAPSPPGITLVAEEEDDPMVDGDDDVEEIPAPIATQVAESSKAKGKARDEGRVMEKKCKTCHTKERECVVDKGKRRCTECEGAKTKCSFVPDLPRARTRAATKAQTVEDTPRPLKRKRGVDSAPKTPVRHIPIVEITTASPATLPSIPVYLTKESINTASNLRLELELSQSEVLDLQEENFRLSDALLASERALQRTRERLAHERELFRAQLDRLRGTAPLDG